MMAKKSDLFNSVFKTYIRSNSTLESEDLDYYVKSMSFLEEILKKTQTAFILIDYTDWSYRYVSSNCYDIIGHNDVEMLQNGPKYGLSAVNTEDLKIQVNQIHPAMVEEFKGLPDSLKRKYKFSFNFRYTHLSGKELQILQTNIFLKWDEEGNPLLKLILFNDISLYKKDNSVLYFVSKINEMGENEIVNQKNITPKELSSREIEILQMIAHGKKINEIAADLSLSPFTIKNHKKNILSKLGCKNSSQAMSLGKYFGIIN
jgi:DNA-binding CsgD family transcriptional regulator